VPAENEEELEEVQVPQRGI